MTPEPAVSFGMVMIFMMSTGRGGVDKKGEREKKKESESVIASDRNSDGEIDGEKEEVAERGSSPHDPEYGTDSETAEDPEKGRGCRPALALPATAR
jgi:hypothetical protein